VSLRAIPPLIGLTADPGLVSASDLAHVASAMQTQVTHDFAPHWHVSATITAFPNIVPDGYWPIIVKESLGEPGALGYHADKHRQPIAYVEHTPDWPTTVSHELLEMLADPFGSRTVLTGDPRGSGPRAHVLIEVCDPCEAFTYDVLGVPVSDFVLPGYYGSKRLSGWADPGGSFLGKVHPLEVARGGYLSWRTATGEWWQRTFFGSNPADRSLGELAHFAEPGDSAREAVDRVMRTQLTARI